MTKFELKEISLERQAISDRLAILNPDNSIESQEIDRLLNRLDFLEYKIDCSLVNSKRQRFKLVWSQ